MSTQTRKRQRVEMNDESRPEAPVPASEAEDSDAESWNSGEDPDDSGDESYKGRQGSAHIIDPSIRRKAPPRPKANGMLPGTSTSSIRLFLAQPTPPEVFVMEKIVRYAAHSKKKFDIAGAISYPDTTTTRQFGATINRGKQSVKIALFLSEPSARSGPRHKVLLHTWVGLVFRPVNSEKRFIVVWDPNLAEKIKMATGAVPQDSATPAWTPGQPLPLSFLTSQQQKFIAEVDGKTGKGILGIWAGGHGNTLGGEGLCLDLCRKYIQSVIDFVRQRKYLELDVKRDHFHRVVSKNHSRGSLRQDNQATGQPMSTKV